VIDQTHLTKLFSELEKVKDRASIDLPNNNIFFSIRFVEKTRIQFPESQAFASPSVGALLTTKSIANQNPQGRCTALD